MECAEQQFYGSVAEASVRLENSGKGHLQADLATERRTAVDQLPIPRCGSVHEQ